MERSNQRGPALPDGGYHVQAEYSDETPTLALARAIAALEGCEMRALPQFSDYVDLPALNRLIQRAHANDHDVTVEVDIEDYTAVVRDDGTITVHEDDTQNTTD